VTRAAFGAWGANADPERRAGRNDTTRTKHRGTGSAAATARDGACCLFFPPVPSRGLRSSPGGEGGLPDVADAARERVHPHVCHVGVPVATDGVYQVGEDVQVKVVADVGHLVSWCKKG
jgi:hypothetical protein